MKKILFTIVLFITFIGNGYAVGIGHSAGRLDGLYEEVSPGGAFQWEQFHSYFTNMWGDDECLSVEVKLSNGLSFSDTEDITVKELGPVCEADFSEEDRNIIYFDIDMIYVKSDAEPGLESISIYVNDELENEPYYIIISDENGSTYVDIDNQTDKETAYINETINYTFTFTNTGDKTSEIICFPNIPNCDLSSYFTFSELLDLNSINITSSYFGENYDMSYYAVGYKLYPGETLTITASGTVNNDARVGDELITTFKYDDGDVASVYVNNIMVVEDEQSDDNQDSTQSSDNQSNSEDIVDDPNNIENPQTGIRIYYLIIPLTAIIILGVIKNKRKIFKI